MLPVQEYLSRPSLLFLSILTHFFKWLPDKVYLRLLFRFKMGYPLNLRNPQTFSEKLQWLKLYNRRPEYTKMVDKFEAKKYVASIIGEQYIIPTLGVWENPEDIEWGSLPDQFVLKTTHGGGNTGVVICKDKSSFDRRNAIQRLSESLKQDIYLNLREWPYKNVKKRVIAETYMSETNDVDLKDYKFFCFNGVPEYCQVIGNRHTRMTVDFFDKNWVHQPFHEPKETESGMTIPKRPQNFELMLSLASKLSKKFPFLRVDFYEIQDKVYFGELTFFPTSGMGGFSPSEWDSVFGSLILLSGFSDCEK